MNINWLEWLGYIASVVVLVSLLMSSIKKLRWINLIGSCAFSVYGFLLGSLPIGIMNLGIVAINIWYIVQIYSSKEYFNTLHLQNESEYLTSFLEFYKDDIAKFNEKKRVDIKNAVIKFFILRNMLVAGVFICSEHDKDTLKIELDFATPNYRDFKIGRYVFEHEKDYFINKGYLKFVSLSENPAHIKYLKKMGFKEHTEKPGLYVKIIA